MIRCARAARKIATVMGAPATVGTEVSPPRVGSSSAFVVGQGYPATPGLHSDEQVVNWRTVTDAVHAAGGVIFAQLMHSSRIGHKSLLPGELAPSARPRSRRLGRCSRPRA